MIKYGEPNPLNIFNLRRLNYCSPHLEKVHFDSKVHDRVFVDWIYENLEGRFYLGDDIVEQSDGNIVVQKVVAFEIHSESTFFCFMLDKLNKSAFTI